MSSRAEAGVGSVDLSSEEIEIAVVLATARKGAAVTTRLQVRIPG